jgi:hypothetical protein
MTRKDFAFCAVVAAIGAYGVWDNQRHPAALPLSDPFGTYPTRAEAFQAVSRLADRGICAKVDPVNDSTTEVQPC